MFLVCFELILSSKNVDMQIKQNLWLHPSIANSYPLSSPSMQTPHTKSGFFICAKLHLSPYLHLPVFSKLLQTFESIGSCLYLHLSPNGHPPSERYLLHSMFSFIFFTDPVALCLRSSANFYSIAFLNLSKSL